MTANRLILLRVACIAFVTVTSAGGAAIARERPDLPGRGPRQVEKMLIFNVASDAEGKQLNGANVSCEFGRVKKQKRTDSTGTAPLAFAYERYPVGREREVECLISKAGYMPEYRRLDLADGPASRLIRVDLAPR